MTCAKDKVQVLQSLISLTSKSLGIEVTPLSLDDEKDECQILANLYNQYQKLASVGGCQDGEFFLIKEKEKLYCFLSKEVEGLISSSVSFSEENKKILSTIQELYAPSVDVSSRLEFYECLEEKYPPVGNYLAKRFQKDVNQNMRSMNVEWLLELASLWNLSDKILFLSIRMFDYYLTLEQVKRNNLQLLACACVNIAADFHQHDIEADDFVTIAADSFTYDMFILMKIAVQKRFSFTVLFPTTLSFLIECATEEKLDYRNSLFMAASTLFHPELLEYSCKDIALACLHSTHQLAMDKEITKVAEKIFQLETNLKQSYQDILQQRYSKSSSVPRKLPDTSSPSSKKKLLFGKCSKGTEEFKNEPVQKIKPLGQGVFGSVYQVKGLKSGVISASKVIRPVNNSFHYTATQEIGILKEISHPSIIKILDYIPGKLDTIQVIYELMSGDLQKQELEMPTVKKFLRQILEGLKFLHVRGIIHGDLKGANLLVKDGTVKIADFGLARMINSGESQKGVVITLWWRPPEVLEEKSFDTSADIWSVGIIMLEMLGYLNVVQGINEDDQYEIVKEKIGKGNFSHLFPKLRSTEIDFLKKLLVLDPSKRMTAEEALQHPFLKDE
jgi:hypothetical protein